MIFQIFKDVDLSFSFTHSYGQYGKFENYVNKVRVSKNFLSKIVLL